MSFTKQNVSTYFHQPQKPRVNNLTYISSGMADSLKTLNPPNHYAKNLVKTTEYRKNFQRTFCPAENLPYVRPSIYVKYSKVAFEKNRSMMSNYGATILRQSNKKNEFDQIE